jgi:D-alanyl-D-alanine carboxypeptidase (penicillin-binding protein 5/6)
VVNLKKCKLLISLLLIVILVCPSVVLADDDDEEDIDENELQQIVESSTLPTEEPVINSRSAIIYDRTTKKVIWGKNEDTKRAMASTTKIMTAIVVLENADLTQTVTISKKAANTVGSRLKLNTGDKITVNDLLYGLMLRSRK